MLISKQVDGVIIISSDDSDDDVNRLDEASIPVVIADRLVDHKSADNIIVDNEKGGYLATKYLLSLGFKKIGCIGGPIFISSSSQRVAGYKRALLEEGIEIRDEYITYGDFHFAGGIDAFEKYKIMQDKPKAIFATNDMMALGFINGLNFAGMNAPSDISVIGFDDTQLSRMSIPKLTTIAQPLKQLAQIATDLILKRIENNEDEVSQVILEPVLIERESCRRSN
jgi:LacI family transcriptional regulator